MGLTKRANAVSDTVAIVIGIFVVSIFFFISYQAFDDVKPDLDADITNPNASDFYNQVYTTMPGTLDSAIIFALVLLWIGGMILSLFIDSHPVWFIFTALLFIGILIAGAILSNTFMELIEEASLKASFPMTVFVFDHFIGFIMGFGFSIAIALYGKTLIR